MFLRHLLLLCLAMLLDSKPPLSLNTEKTWPRSTVYYAEFNSPENQQRKNMRMPRSQFIPKPQFCPETGRTVCIDVKEYPSEELFETVRNTGSHKFDFSTLFVDERENDSEPNLEDIPINYPASNKPFPKNQFFYRTAIRYNYQPTYGHGYLEAHQIDTPESNTKYYDNYAEKYGVKGYRKRRQSSTLMHDIDKIQHFDYNPWRPIIENMSIHPSKIMGGKNINGHNGIRRRVKRQSIRGDRVEICRTQKMFITPKAALNDKSEWKYIVNLGDRDPKLKQVIKVDLCRSPKKGCSNQVSIPYGYTSICKQKYIKKKLLAFNSDGQGTSTESFFVPSCCVCKITRKN